MWWPQLTVPIVKGITVLLHKHDEAVEDNENGVCPRPVPVNSPTDDCSKVYGLPDLPRMSVNQRGCP